ncbi:hypothetical protein [Streptomyces lincolnensis]|nr:hypothetical protein [Streptomyces lincolnensis]
MRALVDAALADVAAVAAADPSHPRLAEVEFCRMRDLSLANASAAA